jgi:hypothetical protein
MRGKFSMHPLVDEWVRKAVADLQTARREGTGPGASVFRWFGRAVGIGLALRDVLLQR